MLDTFICIDFEASALENGYPIEVALADPVTGHVNSWLIRPAERWLKDLVWSPASEAVHGISRALLEAEGQPAGLVYRNLLHVSAERRLISDSPSYDRRWLKTLAGGDEEQAFTGDELEELLDLDMVAWAFAQAAALAALSGTRRARSSDLHRRDLGKNQHDANPWLGRARPPPDCRRAKCAMENNDVSGRPALRRHRGTLRL